MSESTGAEASRLSIAASTKACLQCRRVKMKCCPVVGSSKCERCLRKSIDCVSYVQRKRGRKPSRPRPGDGKTLQISERQAVSREVSGTASVMDRVDRSDLPATPSLQQDTSCEVDDADSNFLSEVDGLQPSSLLSQSATKGKFSMANILSIGRDPDGDPTQPPSALPEGDPIIKGILSYHIATSLFEGFIRSFNPFICVFDPSIHTFQYVREQSSFLLTVMLSVSAKAYNPTLHSNLHRHSEKLFTDAIARGAKSPEIIQALVLKTYWKQSDDTRSWPIIGYAIRLSMELGWHKLVLKEEDMTNMSTGEILKRRNIERTWLVLFVYDRSMSLQNGKPWMIERSDFIESVDIWYKSPLATTNDTILAAFVSLRLTAADILEAFNPQRPIPSMSHPYRFDSLLKSLTPRIEAWQRRWLEIASEKERCHPFLISFFSTHLLLLLHSFPLQDAISSTTGPSVVDTEAFWVTYSSAIDMLKLVSHHSLSPLLSFAHDSIHTMTAYAAVFLIKLLLSIKHSARKEYESTVIDAIDTAARVFDQQSTPPTFTCALQANFLRNVVQEYRKACRRQIFRHTTNQENCPSPYEQDPAVPTRPESTDTTIISDQARQWVQPEASPEASRFRTSQAYEREREYVSDYHRLSSNNYPEQVPNMTPISQDAAGQDPSPSNWEFTDDDWALLFMNAGFDIADGVFIPV